jgi:hypothetical protein
MNSPVLRAVFAVALTAAVANHVYRLTHGGSVWSNVVWLGIDLAIAVRLVIAGRAKPPAAPPS